jgi:HPt (histidine-containing phosphotransfer) domain-containing protein
MTIFLQDHGDLLKKVGQSIQNSDPKGLEEAAHALKGMCANLSVTSTRNLAHRLEKIGASGDLSNAETVLAELKEALNKAVEIMSEFIDEKGDEK